MPLNCIHFISTGDQESRLNLHLWAGIRICPFALTAKQLGKHHSASTCEKGIEAVTVRGLFCHENATAKTPRVLIIRTCHLNANRSDKKITPCGIWHTRRRISRQEGHPAPKNHSDK